MSDAYNGKIFRDGVNVFGCRMHTVNFPHQFFFSCEHYKHIAVVVGNTGKGMAHFQSPVAIQFAPKTDLPKCCEATCDL